MKTTAMSEYGCWENMRARCNNPACKDYPMYGGAGIAVCERWNSFRLFLDDMGPRPEGTSIERIDGTRGYEPDNCKWATPKQQAENRKTTKRVTYLGRTQSRAAWAREYGLSPSVVIMRVNSGWSIDKALTTPVRSIAK